MTQFIPTVAALLPNATVLIVWFFLSGTVIAWGAYWYERRYQASRRQVVGDAGVKR